MSRNFLTIEMARHTVLQLGTPTFLEALGFDLGTIRKLMIWAIFSQWHLLRQVHLINFLQCLLLENWGLQISVTL